MPRRSIPMGRQSPAHRRKEQQRFSVGSPFLLLLVVASACTEARPLIETRAADSGCAHGGVRVVTGQDEDGDGKLANAEIEDEELLCAPAPGVDLILSIG